ncbi:DNA primase large subunit isoform X2 [Dermacentor albipictus]|uniref:DNA primase large subunit isoform X2 n=1 Tax=Dermacentor albipictus TaxID=60249 RepID=UPI0031FC3C68
MPAQGGDQNALDRSATVPQPSAANHNVVFTQPRDPDTFSGSDNTDVQDWLQLYERFAGHKRRRHVAVGDPLAEYAGRKTLLHFYNIPPTDNIPLSDFEEVALERLKVLKVFEVAEAKFNNKRSQEYASAVMDDLRKQKLKAFVSRVTDDNGAAIVRKDNLSFFILMLAFCETPAQRRWFTSQEMDLFRFRFQNESAAGIQAFLKDTNMEFTPISADEKAKYFQEIVAASPDMTAAKLDSMDVYKVSFLDVLPLVSDRTVYLRHGEAYVPSEYLITLVESQYRAHLSHMLAQTTRIFHRLEEDERIVPVLRALANFDAGSGFDASRPTDSVSPEMIDQLCKESFPMCMKVMHAALRTNHHLRHGARMQYGLFLKGIGLALQDALRFWREEFSKHVGIENLAKLKPTTACYHHHRRRKLRPVESLCCRSHPVHHSRIFPYSAVPSCWHFIAVFVERACYRGVCQRRMSHSRVKG